jgi:hypothetical protein
MAIPKSLALDLSERSFPDKSGCGPGKGSDDDPGRNCGRSSLK